MMPCENAKLSNAVIILHMSLPKMHRHGDIPRKFERKKERKLSQDSQYGKASKGL